MAEKLNILIIPMDDRPCTYDFPRQIGEISGANIIIPPKELMGNLDSVADPEKLKSWINSNSENLSGIIIASDTLAYGGLIPSRRNYDSFDHIASNLAVIRDIKNKNKKIPIYVCSTILRISNSNENQEEKEYWKDYGELIHKYSSLLDKNYLVNESDYDQYFSEKIVNPKTVNAEITKLKELIPENIIDDYILGRFRNFKVNKLLLKWVKEGYIDFLVICADDSSQYGFNVIEKKILQKIVEDSNYKNLVNIYPGTDEAVSSLVARLINKSNNFTPKFFPIYSKSENIITMYEGIPLKDTLSSQVKVMGGELVNSKEDSDIILYIHTSQNIQEDQYLNAIYKKETVQLSDNTIYSEIDKFNSENIALIDVCFANGGDNKFMKKLSENFDLNKLLTYSAWNTAGNSIGTALAHSSIRFFTKNRNDSLSEQKHYQFLFERFFDDWLYQGFERLEFIGKNGFPLSQEQLKLMSNELKPILENLIINLKKSNFKDIKIINISYPWKRPFEIDIKTNVLF